MPDILLHLLPLIAACLIYAVLSMHFWRRQMHQEQVGEAKSRTTRLREHLGILAALSLQSLSLYSDIFGADSMRFSFSLALSMMLWLAVLIYWLEGLRSGMNSLQPMMLPLAAVCTALPALFPQVHVIAYANALGFKLHFMSAMLAYSLFTLSALHAVFMGFAERKLHQKEINSFFSELPSILSMEATLFRMISLGFALLTVTLVSGLLFSEAIFGKALSFDHKTLFALASWGIFAALLTGRSIYGWRGRIALRWTLTGFLLLLLAYVGSRFVVEVILGRI